MFSHRSRRACTMQHLRWFNVNSTSSTFRCSNRSEVDLSLQSPSYISQLTEGLIHTDVKSMGSLNWKKTRLGSRGGNRDRRSPREARVLPQGLSACRLSWHSSMSTYLIVHSSKRHYRDINYKWIFLSPFLRQVCSAIWVPLGKIEAYESLMSSVIIK